MSSDSYDNSNVIQSKIEKYIKTYTHPSKYQNVKRDYLQMLIRPNQVLSNKKQHITYSNPNLTSEKWIQGLTYDNIPSVKNKKVYLF